jgi:hypothetical protein
MHNSENFEKKKIAPGSPEEEQDYVDLLHSIADKPCVVDGELQEERFGEVIELALPLARKPKEWFSIWSNCRIEGDNASKGMV